MGVITNRAMGGKFNFVQAALIGAGVGAGMLVFLYLLPVFRTVGLYLFAGVFGLAVLWIVGTLLRDISKEPAAPDGEAESADAD